RRCSAAASSSTAPTRTPARARSASRIPARSRLRTSARSSRRSSSGSHSAARSPSTRSSRARTTSTPTCPRATRSASTSSRSAGAARCTCRRPRARTWSASRARTSKRTRRRRCTPAGRPAAASAPTTRSSTSTAAARRCSRSSASPTSARLTIVELGVSDAEMEKGTLRADVNVSVRKRGEDGFRPRWELKNMNSFTFIRRGIEAAIREQIAAYERGEILEQSTYDYDPDTDRLTVHRSKEEADDYRYFPEPDLVPIEPPAELGERLRDEIGELPAARIRRLAEAVGFDVAEELVM